MLFYFSFEGTKSSQEAGFRINLGTEALIGQNAARQYHIAGTDKSRSARKLSSGYRILSAADDAAGLSISEKMRRQIRGLDKASQNINDGISYVQVADAALAEVQSMMHRINELSIQASNDTNTAADRLAIDNEIQDLKQEINRIFDTTEFNTRKIWDTNGTNQIQIGTQSVPAVTAKYQNTSQSFSISENNKWLIASSGYKVTATKDTGIQVSWTGYDGNQYATTDIPWPSADLAGTTLTIEIGKYLDTATYPALANSGINFRLSYDISDVATLDDVVKAIDGTSFSSSTSAPTRANIITADGTTRSSYSKNGVSVSFSSSISYTAQLAADRIFQPGYTDTAFIEPLATQPDNFNNPVSDTGTWSAGFTLGTAASNPLATPNFNGNAVSNRTYYYGFINEPNNPDVPGTGRKYWWYHDKYGYHTPSHTPQGAGGTPESAENALINPGSSNYPLSSTQKGGTIDVGFTLSGNYSTPTGSHSSIGSLTMALQVKPDTTLDEIMDLLADIKTVDIYASGLGTAFAGSQRVNTVLLDKPVYQSEINLHIQTSDVAYDHIAINYRSLRLENLGLSDTNTQTREEAQKAIAASADALAIVSEQRSLFGSYQNRLESANVTTENTWENVQNAESRLRDTDMAEEMVRYSMADILTQAEEAVMAQSNSNLSQVLSLLQSAE